MRLTLNPNPKPARLPIDPAALARAAAAITAWPGYAPTPIQDVPYLATRLGVASAQVKLEAHRFTVGSFKALGPPYALACELRRRNALADAAGNHGRALAWGATRLGAKCRIFMPAHTSPGREAAIRALGAEVTRIPGSFDDAAQAAAEAGSRPHHILVADLPVNGSTAIPEEILHGYALLAREIRAQSTPTHVFVAAGNGTLTAAICAGLNGTSVVCAVEPLASDTIRRSLAAGHPVPVPPAHSIMDGLLVAEPSATAWPLLRAGLDAALAIPDAQAHSTLREAAAANLPIGETGIAALAGLIAAASDPALARALAITPASHLLAIACEGITDPKVLANLIATPEPDR